MSTPGQRQAARQWARSVRLLATARTNYMAAQAAVTLAVDDAASDDAGNAIADARDDLAARTIEERQKRADFNAAW